MDIQAIGNIISSVGFPIFCVIMMWQYINTTQKELTEVIRQNTEVLRKIEGKIEVASDD